jgi:hypothetical protein
MISEKLNTKSRINRRLSITVSAVTQVKNTEKSWNGIIPTRVPGMTSADSPKSQPQASKQAVVTQSFHGILRATRMKTTPTTQHGADRQLIGANQPQQRVDKKSPHCGNNEKRFRRASISSRQTFRCPLSLALTPLTGRVKRRTRSHGGISTVIKRKASRPCRLIALRNEAARAKRLGTIKPSRVQPFALARQ